MAASPLAAVVVPQNPLDLPTHKLSIGCPAIDSLLAGGVCCGSVTELAGESSAGKTQICLLLALRSSLPFHLGGLQSACLFIYSEPPFPLRRLSSLSSFLPFSSATALDHILVAAARSVDDLLRFLDIADSLLHRPPTGMNIRLLIVDSIAALFRAEFDNDPRELKVRASLFFRIAGKLKEQAARFGAAVVITNQATDVAGGDWGRGSGSTKSSGRLVAAALGISWANCVNTRIFLTRNEEITETETEGHDDDDGGGSRVTTARRRMHVAMAPHLPESSCEFAIVSGGIVGVSK